MKHFLIALIVFAICINVAYAHHLLCGAVVAGFGFAYAACYINID